MKLGQKVLIAGAVTILVWIGIKIFIVVGAILMRKPPDWLTN